MARTERPVDPAAGPLEAFAAELRKLRTEAGNPTYRALAKVAGYSATTLSEAAAGRRRPSLDVTLAYAGACGGDPQEWRRRWHELPAAADPDDADTGPAAVPGPAAVRGPVAVAGPDDAAAGADGGVRRRRAAPRWALAGCGAVAVVALLAATSAALWPSGDGGSEAGTGCPAKPATVAFTGTTYGTGVQLRSGPSRDQPARRLIPGGCTIAFSGYCVGQLVSDGTASTPDVRWFMTSGGVVSSALIHGNPPAQLRPSRCAHDRPVPQSISLRLTAGADGATTLSAAGAGVDIAGFAAGYSDDPAKPWVVRWHQLTLTAGHPDLTATWPAGRTTGPVLLAAVACLGGGGPTTAAAVMSMPAGHPEQAAAVTPAAAELATARRSACQYPTVN